MNPRLLFTLLFILLAIPGARGDVPGTPENLRAAHLYPDEALLTWNEVAGADGYRIYRFDEGTSTWITLEPGTSLTHFRDTGVTNASTSYAVAAFNPEGEGTAVPGTATADPNSWMVFNLMREQWSIYDTVARVGWSASLAAGSDGILELGLTPDDFPYFAWDTNFTGVHWFTVTNLSPGTEYYMRITGVGPNGAGSSGMTSFTTLPTNHPPVPFEQVFSTTEDSGPLFVYFNAWDPDGHWVTVQPVGQPQNGQLIPGEWGALYYVPNSNFFGIDQIVFQASDGKDSALGTNIIQVVGINDPPTAANTSASQPEDSPIIHEIVLPAFDVDGDFLQVIFTSQPANGSVTSFGTSCYYFPNPNFNGTDSFTYKVSDWMAESAEATVTVTVIPVNDPPSGNPQLVATDEDTPITLTPETLDIDGDALTYEVAILPSFGTVAVAGSQLVYTPSTNFNGWDMFSYRASDGSAWSDFIPVNVEVRSINDPPITQNLSFEIAEDTAGTFPLVASDPEMDGVLFSIVAEGTHGTVFLSGDTAFYTPNANFNGTDTFTFSAQDGSAEGNISTVSITVTPVNDAPTANDLSVTTAEDTNRTMSLAGSDLDGDALSLTIVSPPSHGTLIGSGLSRTYRPAADYAGPDSFQYRLTDPGGLSAEATVNITVTPLNDAPVTIGQSVMMEEDTVANVRLLASDYDRDFLTYTIVEGPAHGTVTQTGSNVVYTPNPNYFGSDQFVYVVSDGVLESVPTVIDFGILPVPDAPVATPGSATTAYNTPVPLGLTGTDGDGDPLTYTVSSLPANGTLSGAAPNLTFTPNTGWAGTTSFNFKVNDGTLDSALATITITVQPPASLPTAPSGLTAVALSSSEIRLSWSDNSANLEDGFAIERAGTGNAWLPVATVGRDVASFTAVGLASNKSYTFRVRAFNLLGNSGYSNSATAKTSR